MTYERSSFDLSVPTGLALESVFIPTDIRVDDQRVVTLKHINRLDVSIYTLIRNILHASDLQVRSNVPKYSKYIIKATNAEMATLVELGTAQGTLMQFYTSTPTLNINDGVSMRVKIVRQTLELESKFNLYPKYKGSKTPILTANTYDLLLAKQVLESTTGNMLKLVDFNKKLNSSKTMDTSRLPFNKLTLTIFGDRYGLVKPMSIRIRRLVIIALQQAGVTPLKSESWIHKHLPTEVSV